MNPDDPVPMDPAARVALAEADAGDVVHHLTQEASVAWWRRLLDLLLDTGVIRPGSDTGTTIADSYFLLANARDGTILRIRGNLVEERVTVPDWNLVRTEGSRRIQIGRTVYRLGATIIDPGAAAAAR